MQDRHVVIDDKQWLLSPLQCFVASLPRCTLLVLVNCRLEGFGKEDEMILLTKGVTTSRDKVQEGSGGVDE